MLHVILRWYRLVAFQTCTGTFRALSQCASTNIKALQLISALSGETSGLAAKAVQRNAVCSARRKMELQFEHHCHLISLCCIQRVSWISGWAFAQHWLKAAWLPWESHVWSPCVPAPEKWMFLAPGALLHVMFSFYPSIITDLPFLTRDSYNT